MKVINFFSVIVRVSENRMENELDLSAEKEKGAESRLNDQVESKNSSRKTRDSSLLSESDLEERADSTEDHEEEEGRDYSGFSKPQFVELIKTLTNEKSFNRVDLILKEVQPLFEEIRQGEKSAALQKFLADGGIAEDFQFNLDEHDRAFDATVKALRSKRNKHYKALESQKNENLEKKNQLLEQLRTLVDGEETANSFKAFKEIQSAWKSTGSVPGHHSRTLWANYIALVDRFYDQRNISFELIELDRKKNLEAKIELCQRAEQLDKVESIKEAAKELNALHDEFKHIGPVSRENKEDVWQRFKAASDGVYARRDAMMAELLDSFKRNKEEKLNVIQQVLAFTAFDTDSIKEWNQKTKEILDIQKKWEAIGPVGRSDTKEINRKFWSSFKEFFGKKNVFFKRLDGQREENLKRKEELILKAEELKESKDWDKTSNALKALQVEWKNIGPVPEKKRVKVYKRFKNACDYFFNQRREQFGKLDEEQQQNLSKKDAICEEMEKVAVQKSGSLDELRTLIDQFNGIGFVPKNTINKSKKRYDKAVQSYLDNIEGLEAADKDRVLMEMQLATLRNDPQGERKIHHKEQHIRKQINKAENDIAILKNNMEFFGRSRNAEKFKSQFNEKLELATSELQELKKQLKLLKTVS